MCAAPTTKFRNGQYSQNSLSATHHVRCDVRFWENKNIKGKSTSGTRSTHVVDQNYYLIGNEFAFNQVCPSGSHNLSGTMSHALYGGRNDVSPLHRFRFFLVQKKGRTPPIRHARCVLSWLLSLTLSDFVDPTTIISSPIHAATVCLHGRSKGLTKSFPSPLEANSSINDCRSLRHLILDPLCSAPTQNSSLAYHPFFKMVSVFCCQQR
jgi:hypothetical protein